MVNVSSILTMIAFVVYICSGFSFNRRFV